MRIAALGSLSAAWVLVPFLLDRWAVNDSSFNSQGAFADSFGWRRVGGWLLAGASLDAGRVPVLSAIAAVGLLVVLARWSAAMMEFRREHDLAFTPGQVWAVLLDFEGHRQWNPYVRLELLHSDPIALRYWLRMAVRSSLVANDTRTW